ncbi:serine hydrolase domain-containing protein [Streptoalloteichus hindustanus]|uniref:D-alanyl-D-alanine carboxypeptidase n=1 Tax=Streptoalloteichus hindustanus TaxID=2017 RepID=A0A1M5FRJ7_STRHI|nr:serine hydrolase domain-containing protein [Streptoalloteichus hindustanus]SHF94128.1 D-alanyl-D-alanine carboxypeptidase [Streptoalloteichus hindustanus]
MSDIHEVLDRAVNEGGVPGVVAEIHHGDDQRFATAGVADTATGWKRQAGEHFRIGSITKTFVSTVMLSLAAKWKMPLDHKVGTWLPRVIRGNGHDGRAITVRQLLNQTSGIANYSLDPEMLQRCHSPAFLDHRFDSYRPEQLVETAMAHPPAFEPGTDWGYSNTNSVLIGMIIEKGTGRTLGEEIQRVITDPLGLTGTYLPEGDDPTLRGPHARHYTKNAMSGGDAPVYDVTELNPSGAWAAGGMVSTTADLNRFFRALLAGEILPPEQQEEMFTTVPTRGWLDNAEYGLGISSVTLSSGATVWGMGGAVNGSWSCAYGTRDGGHVVSMNVNGDWADGDWTNPIGIFTDVLEAEFRPS